MLTNKKVFGVELEASRIKAMNEAGRLGEDKFVIDLGRCNKADLAYLAGYAVAAIAEDVSADGEARHDEDLFGDALQVAETLGRHFVQAFDDGRLFNAGPELILGRYSLSEPASVVLG